MFRKTNLFVKEIFHFINMTVYEFKERIRKCQLKFQNGSIKYTALSLLILINVFSYCINILKHELLCVFLALINEKTCF